MRRERYLTAFTTGLIPSPLKTANKTKPKKNSKNILMNILDLKKSFLL